MLKLADGRTWQPRWRLDATQTVVVIALPTRPNPSALILDSPSIEALMVALAEARGQMRPAATGWQTDALLRRIRARWLAI